MRRIVTALVIVVATLPLPVRAASVPVLVIDGRGFGHGVGMAQDGAYWMGAAGARTEQILGHFYPGASIGRGQGPVRVAVGDAGPAPSEVVLGFPDGGLVRDGRSGEQAEGFPVEVPPGGRVRVSWDGTRHRVERLGGTVAMGRPRLTSQVVDPTTTTSTTAPQPPPTASTTSTTSTTAPLVPGSTTTTTEAPRETTTTTTTAPPAPPPTTRRPVWAAPAGGGTVALLARQRSYRGLLEVSAAAGRLRVVNEVDVETYLKGMGEVRDPRWPAASLRAQAIAARTYALRAMLVGGGEICDTQRCQVYLGAHAEYAAMNRAVDDTRGQVLVHDRQLISAVYSANGGGHSASREEGFGVPEDRSAPYLRPAPYLTQDPLPWSVTVGLDAVAARLGYGGAIRDVRVSRVGPSGRALEVTVDGTAGSRRVPGIAFDAALGLRSTLFTLRVDVSDVAPPAPPPPEDVVQAPPEQAAATVDAAPPSTALPRASRSRPMPRVTVTPDPTESTDREITAVFASWALLAVGGITALQTRFWVRSRGHVPRERTQNVRS